MLSSESDNFTRPDQDYSGEENFSFSEFFTPFGWVDNR